VPWPGLARLRFLPSPLAPARANGEM